MCVRRHNERQRIHSTRAHKHTHIQLHTYLMCTLYSTCVVGWEGKQTKQEERERASERAVGLLLVFMSFNLTNKCGGAVNAKTYKLILPLSHTFMAHLCQPHSKKCIHFWNMTFYWFLSFELELCRLYISVNFKSVHIWIVWISNLDLWLPYFQ